MSMVMMQSWSSNKCPLKVMVIFSLTQIYGEFWSDFDTLWACGSKPSTRAHHISDTVIHTWCLVVIMQLASLMRLDTCYLILLRISSCVTWKQKCRVV